MNESEIKKLKKAVFKKTTLVFDQLTRQQKTKTYKLCESYKDFLDRSKTEREAAKQIVRAAKKGGFVDIDTLLTKKQNSCFCGPSKWCCNKNKYRLKRGY